MKIIFLESVKGYKIEVTCSADVTSCLLVTGWQLVVLRMEQSVMQFMELSSMLTLGPLILD